jgi:outer membrane autotransporter protein
MLALAGPLAAFLSSGSLNLAAAGGDSLPEIQDGLGLWVGGKARFGTWDQTASGDRLRFSTDGISAGIDRRFREDLVLGLGFGYARDDTEVGFNGTNSNSTARSVTGYGSYQPTPDVFVDALVGYGVTNLDTQRFVSSTGAFAWADRDGDQVFASLAAGYDFRLERALLSPYARLDYAYDTLDQVTETGAGTDSLTYLEESFSTFQLALGIRGESRHAMRFGWIEPRAFIEYQHNFEGDRPATLVYADQARGPRFSVSPSSIVRDALYVGLGSDLVFRNGTRLGLDYELELLASDESSQALRLWLSKDFDGKRVTLPAAASASSLFKNPVRVEAGYAFEDNLNRTREADRLSDSVYSLNISQGRTFSLSPNSRFVARWLLDGVKLHTYSGLDHLSGGLNGELQYRSSGSFGTPTFGLFARAALDEYDSGQRDGYRYSFGVNVRKSLTDRLHLFAALARNDRNADSVVFECRGALSRRRVPRRRFREQHERAAHRHLDTGRRLRRSRTFRLAIRRPYRAAHARLQLVARPARFDRYLLDARALRADRRPDVPCIGSLRRCGRIAELHRGQVLDFLPDAILRVRRGSRRAQVALVDVPAEAAVHRKLSIALEAGGTARSVVAPWPDVVVAGEDEWRFTADQRLDQRKLLVGVVDERGVADRLSWRGAGKDVDGAVVLLRDDGLAALRVGARADVRGAVTRAEIGLLRVCFGIPAGAPDTDGRGRGAQLHPRVA